MLSPDPGLRHHIAVLGAREASLGYEVKTFIRTESELASIARYKPFEESRLESAGAFCVGFLAEPPGAAARSESTFSNVRFEKALKIRATFRGINTVTRLAAKYARTS
jgi:hypothetical protein